MIHHVIHVLCVYYYLKKKTNLIPNNNVKFKNNHLEVLIRNALIKLIMSYHIYKSPNQKSLASFDNKNRFICVVIFRNILYYCVVI